MKKDYGQEQRDRDWEEEYEAEQEEIDRLENEIK